MEYGSDNPKPLEHYLPIEQYTKIHCNLSKESRIIYFERRLQTWKGSWSSQQEPI